MSTLPLAKMFGCFRMSFMGHLEDNKKRVRHVRKCYSFTRTSQTAQNTKTTTTIKFNDFLLYNFEIFMFEKVRKKRNFAFLNSCKNFQQIFTQVSPLSGFSPFIFNKYFFTNILFTFIVHVVFMEIFCRLF